MSLKTFRRNFGENIGVLDSNYCHLGKQMIVTRVFMKSGTFSAENRNKNNYHNIDPCASLCYKNSFSSRDP
jgi:hypothetical protein